MTWTEQCRSLENTRPQDASRRGTDSMKYRSKHGAKDKHQDRKDSSNARDFDYRTRDDRLVHGLESVH